MYRFTQSLPYLLNRVGIRMGEQFSRELTAINMTLPMYRVLAALLERGAQRLTDLSAMTTVEMTTLSRLVALMQKRRLVHRRRPKNDLRTLQITLTDTGQAMVARLMPRAAYYEAVATRGLTLADVGTLKSLLGSVFENLAEVEREQQTSILRVKTRSDKHEALKERLSSKRH